MIFTLGFNKYVRSHVQQHMPKSQQHRREAMAGGSQEARSRSQYAQWSKIWSKTKNFQCVDLAVQQWQPSSCLVPACLSRHFLKLASTPTPTGPQKAVCHYLLLLPIILLSHFSTKTTLGALPMVSANPVAQFSAYLSWHDWQMQESDPWACLLGLWLLLGNHGLPGALEQFLPRILSPPPPCRGSGAAHPKPACKLLYSRWTIDLCVLQPRCFDKAKPQIWKRT